MRAGSLDRLITIQVNTPTQNNFGEPIDSWSDVVARLPAGYSPLRGNERDTEAQTVAEQYVEFTVRYQEALRTLNSKYRILYPAPDLTGSPNDTDIYDIKNVAEIGRQDGLRIVARRRPDI